MRKRGTTRFKQSGGKLEPGESFTEAARREVFEELGLDLPSDQLIEHRAYTDVAANEPGCQVVAHVFSARCEEAPAAAAEIEEILWPPTFRHRRSHSPRYANIICFPSPKS
ncbi:NUDIX domain-containing protein [Fulvimarina sp. MAC8]|uniref:NUDIX domain-containing protein n=1 Tax=Fulvimarina sp. MAC8 TaxID=3162874 RepID=UPI0032EBE12C